MADIENIREDDGCPILSWAEQAQLMYPDNPETRGGRASFYTALAHEYVDANFNKWQPVTSRTTDVDSLIQIEDIMNTRETDVRDLANTEARRALIIDITTGSDKHLARLVERVTDIREAAAQKEVTKAIDAARKQAVRGATERENILLQASRIATHHSTNTEEVM